MLPLNRFKPNQQVAQLNHSQEQPPLADLPASLWPQPILADSFVRQDPGAAAQVEPASRTGVAHLQIPYRFKVFQRHKDDETGRMTITLPRHRRPEELAGGVANFKTLALGDLHGSYQKLVETLLATGLVSMPPEAAKQFQQLSKQFSDEIATEINYPDWAQNPYCSYVVAKLNGKRHETCLQELQTLGFAKNQIEDVNRRHTVYQDYYRRFQPLIQQMRWQGAPHQQLILIGDVLSDRGAMDSLTLDILAHLTRQNPNAFVRLASNHDHVGMRAFVTHQMPMSWSFMGSLGRSILMVEENYRIKMRLKPEGDGVKLFLEPAQKNESVAHLESLYKQYLLDSKLMHYAPESGTLYAHAPINSDEINALKSHLWIEHSDLALLGEAPPSTLPPDAKGTFHLVNWGNQFWKKYVQEAFKTKKLTTSTEDLLLGTGDSDGFLWRRDSLQDAAELPFYSEGATALVHGHDALSRHSQYAIGQWSFESGQTSAFVVVNLDQHCGKGIRQQFSCDDSTLYMEC